MFKVNKYILIVPNINSKVWNCGKQQYEYIGINAEEILSNLICSHFKLYKDVVLIVSEKEIFHELKTILNIKLKKDECYILYKVYIENDCGWTYKDYWEWANKLFLNDKIKTCLASCLDMTNYLKCEDII
jgi:hypothetical protein